MNLSLHSLIASLHEHWPEYAIEAFCLAVFMISACLCTALLEHPASPIHQAIQSDFARRGIIGLGMGLTAMGLVYSPWGKRSGAHMNPSVTLGFWKLGKIQSLDAFFYVVFQFIGGWLGVILSAALIPSWIRHPSVAYIVTVPGPGGPAVAWVAEFSISFLLLSILLAVLSRPALIDWTGVFAGALVALYILFESPLSGMSMNPARTLGSALPSGIFDHLWIYFTAPPLGMLIAAELCGKWKVSNFCAKLIHDRRFPCIFCGHSGKD